VARGAFVTASLELCSTTHPAARRPLLQINQAHTTRTTAQPTHPPSSECDDTQGRHIHHTTASCPSARRFAVPHTGRQWQL